MAMLDDIRAGQLLTRTHCSVYEAAAHLMVNRGFDSSEVAKRLRTWSSEMLSAADLTRLVERVGVLVSVWKVFREISEIAESLEHAKGKLVTVRADTVDPPLEEYLDEGGWAIDIPQSSVPDLPDDRKVLREGLLGLAGIKWYLVRTRHLLGSVGGSHVEVDWFWERFGECHHLDVIDLRNRLVHSAEFSRPSSELKLRISWFSRWLSELARKIRRTSVGVPDANGHLACRFSTKEMARLPKADGDRRSAADALLSITTELDPASTHSLKLEVVAFDPETRILQVPEGHSIVYSALLDDRGNQARSRGRRDRQPGSAARARPPAWGSKGSAPG